MMVKTLCSTILLMGVLSAFTVEAAAAGGGTPVTCGSNITAPGNYFLATNCSGPGILISASNVTLKLKGHTMDGLSFYSDGIESFIGVSKVKIIGPGTIRNYSQSGIFLIDVDDSEVQKVTATNNIAYGIFLFNSSDNEIDGNKAYGNGIGIYLVSGSTGNEIEENTANSNVYGILLDSGATGNEVGENRALGNVNDLFDNNADCDNNEWEDNRFNSANQSCID